MAKIKFAALDGSKSNFGIAKLEFDTVTNELSVTDLLLVKTEKSKIKTIRKSSDNLRRAQEIAEVLRAELKDCAIAFCEIPSGAQSADASLAFGIVIGLYASITIPVGEVTPTETKMAAVGTKTASKEEMIIWASDKFPTAPWLRAKANGPKWKKGDLTADNEHLADAVAIAHAGICTPSFKQMISMLSAMNLAA